MSARLSPRSAAMAILATAVVAGGCTQGEIGYGKPVSPSGQRPASAGNQPPPPPGPGGGGPPNGAPPAAGGGASTAPVNGFQVPNTHLKLLPFAVRLARIATVTGVPATDPSYATLLEDRLLLGDHDYANAKPPQEGWSAARLTMWVEGLRPICRTATVRARYSPMPGKLAQLIEAAHGRALLPDDTAALMEGIAGLAITPEKVVETACVSVLSSLEFVAQ